MKTVLRTLSDLSVLSNGQNDTTGKSTDTSDFVKGYIEETVSKETEEEILDFISSDPMEAVEVEEQHHDDVEEAILATESTTDESNTASVDELVQIMISDDEMQEDDYVVHQDTPISQMIADVENQIDEGQQSLDKIEARITDGNEELERQVIIAQLRELFSIVKLPYNEDLWAGLSLPHLKDLLSLATAENGGSVDVAKIIRQTQEEHDTFIKSDIMKSRLRLLEQKGADYSNMMATLSKMFGNDITIKNAKTTEYHAMLKNATMFITTLSGKILQMAEKMGMTVPTDEFLPTKDHVPIVEGLPSDPRVLMYVLNVFYSMIDKIHMQAEFAKIELRKATQEIATMREREKRMQEQLAAATRAELEVRQDYENRIRNSSFYIVVDDAGRIVRKIDPLKELETVSDLDLRGTIDTALFFTSKSSASELADRMMVSRRFYGRTLEVKTVSIV